MNINWNIWLLCFMSILFIITTNSGMAQNYDEKSLKQQGDSYFNEKSYKRAIDAYNTIIQNSPKTKLRSEIRHQTARSYELLESYDTAAQIYEENIKKFPSDIWGARSAQYLAKMIMEDHYYSGDDDALVYYKKAIKLYSSAARYKSDLIEAYFDMAAYHISERDIKELPKAIDVYNKILNLKPSVDIKARSYYAMANSYYVFGRKDPKNFTKAIELLQTVINKFPKSEYVDESHYLQGRIYHFMENFTAAIQSYKKVPRFSKWYKSAVYYIHDITNEQLSIGITRVYFPNEKVEMNLSSRNLKDMKFTAYKADPVEMLKKIKKDDYGYNFWHDANYKKNKIKSWNYDTKDTGEHKHYSGTIQIPIEEAGAYIIECISGNKKAHMLALISNLAMIVKSDSSKTIAYCTEADKGIPLSGIQVTGRVNYTNNLKEKVTDKNGVCELDIEGSKYLIAKYGENYAFSEGYYNYYNQFADNAYNMYAYTERPAYRPGQKINFKAIMRVYQNGEPVPLNNRKVKIKITDPGYNAVYEKDLVTNKYGTLNGEYTLGAEPPLGLYRIIAEIDGTYVNSSIYNHFRVEEYKKPEYEVNINTSPTTYVIGDKIGVDINARYYFGAPVTDGTVTYKVKKMWNLPYYFWWQWDRRKMNYAEIYGEKVVSSGESKVNNEGLFHIDVQTEEEDIKEMDLKPHVVYSYVIEASVTDKSRRQINAVKTLNMGRASFYFTIEPQQTIYMIGDKCKIKIKAKSLNEEPVKTKFTFSLMKSDWINDKWQDTLTDKMEQETDAEGDCLVTFNASKSGYFRLFTKATDDKGREVSSETTFWIADKNFMGGFYKYQGIEIVTDKKNYMPGDVAKILINSEHKDASILLTIGADKLYHHEIVKIEGNSKLVEIPITDAYTPNVFLEVATIRNHKIYQDSKDLTVTPVKNYLNVQVKFPKSKFLPGENAELQVLTTDYYGKPIKSEVSLGITDASVYYIQQEMTPDIKDYYYGYRRSNGIYLKSSFDFSASGITEDIKPFEYLNYSPEPGPNFFGEDDYYLYDYVGAGEGAPEGMLDKSSRPPSAEMDASPKMMTKKDKAKNGNAKETEELQEPKVREFFADTIFWQPCIETDANGIAKVNVNFADSLTTWRATARALTFMTRVGSVTTDVVTSKNLLVRLESPRFFTERDEVYISGIVHNYLDSDQKVKMQLNVDGLTLEDKAEKEVEVKKNSDYRVDWKVKAEKEGKATIKLAGLTTVESDAVKMEFPVLPHGIDKHIIKGGEVKDKAEIKFNLPKEYKKGSENLEFNLSPSFAITMVDALPYLADYPYGCVEQTMSRFLPSVLVARTLEDLKIKIPQSKLDKKELDKMIKAGVKRLTDFHHYDGGWGWWKDDQTNPYMTAYVVFGLTLAKNAGYNIAESLLVSGISYLENNVAYVNDLNTRAYMLFVLSQYKKVNKKALEEVWEKRDNISNYSRALLAMTFSNLKDKKRAEVLIRNIEDRRTIDGDAVYWGVNSGYYCWYDDAVETTAYVMKALIQVTPDSKYIPQIAKWLVLNRRSAHWKSTKDTANVVYAITDYLKHSQELAPDYTLNIALKGKPVKKIKVDKNNLFDFQSLVKLPGITDGDNIVTITKDGKGSLYYSGTLQYYTLEEDIKGVSNEMTIKRDLQIVTSKVVNGQTIEERQPFKGKVNSGDIIEVNLMIKVNNNFEYMMFEDPKPAGCEPVELRSGYAYGNGVCSNMELRDEKVTFFATYLPKGTHSISYKLRAEIPGDFHQMPTKVTAMYVPEIWGIADENRWNIKDK